MRSGVRPVSKLLGSVRRRSAWSVTASFGSKASTVSTRTCANYRGRTRNMATGSKAVAAPERTLVTTRVFDAPPERVYRAWTDPKQVARWFPPEGLTAPVCELDVRVGGALRIDMRGPEGEPFNGALFPGRGVYREVVPNRRLAFTFTPEMEGKAMPSLLMTVEFEDQAGKTKLTIQQTLDTVA